MAARNDDLARRQITSSRVFAAPRALVWKVWSDPAHVAQWWGPRGFTNTIEHMDFRPGGEWRLVMHGPDGTDYPNRWVFAEIREPERLVLDHLGSGHRFRSTVQLTDEGEGTRVTVTMEFETVEAREQTVKAFRADDGLNQNLDRLGEHVAEQRGQAEMMLTRLFAAPRALVFEAWTRVEHLQKWWGPKGFSLPGCELDFRVGGRYRMVMRAPDGTEHPFHGVFREIVPPSRIVFTAVIEGLAGPELITTARFEEEDGRTRLTVTQTRPEGAPGRGQMQGWSEQLERLDGFVTARR